MPRFRTRTIPIIIIQKIIFGSDSASSKCFIWFEYRSDVLKLDEVRILKLKYDLPSCQFLGIIEFIGQFVVRGDAEEVFMD